MIEEQNINQLPKGWKWVKLGDIGEITSSRRIFQNEYADKGVPFFRTKEIKELSEGKDLSVELFITNEKYNEIKSKNEIPKIGDILLSAVGTIGVSYIIKDEKPFYFKDGNLVWIRKLNVIVPKYLHYLFSHFIKFKQKIATSGSAYNALTIIKLKAFDVPLPPKPTQQLIVSKIEELFSELDKGIEQLKTAQQQLKTYRQSVLKWAFEGKLTSLNHDSYDLHDEHDLTVAAEHEVDYKTKNNQGNQNNYINQSSDKGALPKGWKIVELKEVCEIKRGKSKHRPRNEPSLYGGKYPFVQTGDIRNASGKYINSYTQTYSEKGLQQSKLWSKGTLCITIAANIGETAILRFDACFPDSVVGLLCNEKMLSNKYTNYFFISFKQKLEELAPATAQKNINVDILEKVEIPLPPIEEQNNIVQEIESRLSVADKMEESIIQSLQQAEALRQSILKKAFEGRLV